MEAFESPTLAQAAGARWERVYFWWNEIQPNGPQEWIADKAISDKQIDGELQRGMKLVGLLGNPPRWATRNGSVPQNLSLGPADPENHWARFVRNIVKRYAGKIDYWIIWNEPDIDVGTSWSTWAGSEEEYYQLLKAAYLAARAVNPNARIVFGGTTFWADTTNARKLYIERILERAVLDPSSKANGYYFDIVDLHIYSRSWDMYDIPMSYKDVLDRYGIRKPLWITEANVVPWDDPVAPMPPGGYRATLEEQASFIIQGFALAMAAGVERISVYKLVDGGLTHGEAYGLVRNDGSTRPAYAAFQTAARYFSGYSQARYDEYEGMDRVTMLSGDKKLTVLWNPTPLPKSIRVPARGTRATLVNKTGQATPLVVPTIAGQNYFTFDMPRATANVPDIDASKYIIGGDPIILLEEGIGQGIRVSPQEVFYPITGYSVGGGFLEFFEKRGGVPMFGYPRGREGKDGDKVVQLFQKARFEFFPELAGTPYQVQLGLLGQEAANRWTFPEGEPAESTQDKVFFPETGHSVQGPFLKFFKERDG
ncbi:MAG TPA: hypothetical protein VJA25_04755, partial [Dehalococcoidia bacterium]|nr:hypothetical protein [Dehalococcoidia bacterium]